MTVVRIRPGSLKGSLAAPPSKSYTHRALVAGFLGGERFHLERPLDSWDTRATATGLAALGAHITLGRDRWTLDPRALPRRRAPVRIDCGESGTSLRFLAGVAALGSRPVRLDGRIGLARRPMGGLVEALGQLGARSTAAPRGLPLTVRGPIHSGAVRLDATVSSQFASSLLLCLPTVAGDSHLTLEGPVVSEPYIDATLALQRECGVSVERTRRGFDVPGGQRYRATELTVPGDASSAAYFWTAAAITGGKVTVTGIPPSFPQADLAVLDLLVLAGASVRRDPESITVTGGELRPFSCDLTPSPDLYPLAGVLAAAAPGLSRLRGAPHVAVKESDRREGTARLAQALGARVLRPLHGLDIRGNGHLRAVDLHHLTDHRMVMSAAVAALAADGTSAISESEVVGKSFPTFWKMLRQLGARASGP